MGIGLGLRALMAGIGRQGIGAGLNQAGKIAAIQGPRMAAGPAFKAGLGKALFGEMNRTQIAGRLAPDALFGGMAIMQTPGDLGDKILAGGTQFVGGGLGGLATARLAKGLGASEGIETLADFAGSYGGDFAGMAVGDTLQRGKDKIMGGEGLTAWERMSAQQQEEFANQIRNETMSSLGIGPGYLPGMQDQYLNSLGMG